MAHEEIAVSVERVTKRFGELTAVNGVSVAFERGKIHGIIGRNGSGKTVIQSDEYAFLRESDPACIPQIELLTADRPVSVLSEPVHLFVEFARRYHDRAAAVLT